MEHLIDNGRGKLARTAILVTAMMLVFKIIGFIKQSVIAFFFGATVETDIYFVAYGFVTGITESIAKALSVSLVSIYTSIMYLDSTKKANVFASQVLELFLPVSFVITICIGVFANTISSIIAPAYELSQYVILANFIVALSPIIILSTFEFTFCAVLDSHKKFIIPRIQSLVYSIATMLASIILSEILAVKSLVIARYISSAIYILIMALCLKKIYRFSFVPIKKSKNMQEMITSALPLFISISVYYVNNAVDRAIATGLDVGSASALSYCHTLDQLVTSIVIVNISNILFAQFAEYYAKSELDSIYSILKKAINIVMLIMICITVVSVFRASDIVTVVYYRGGFSSEAVVLTSTAFIGYSISFAFVGVRDLLVKCSYSLKDSRSPMICSCIAVLLNIVLSIELSKCIGIFGIAIATSISNMAGMILNAYIIRRNSGYSYKYHIVSFVKSIPAIAVLLFTSYICNMFTDSTIRLLLNILVGVPMYFTFLYIMKIPEVMLVTEIILKKFTKRS